MANVISRCAVNENNEEIVIAFDHIPKCAGTSFGVWLKNACSGNVFSVRSYADQLKFSNHRFYNRDIITGHNIWGIHYFLPPDVNVAYVTMIRDPLKTAISFYTYLMNIYWIDSALDINSFLISYEPNYFTKILGQGDLQKAKTKLFNSYAAFGIV